MNLDEMKDRFNELLDVMQDTGASTGLVVGSWPDDEKGIMHVISVGSDLVDCVSGETINLADLTHGLQLLHKGDPELAHRILNGAWNAVEIALNKTISDHNSKAVH